MVGSRGGRVQGVVSVGVVGFGMIGGVSRCHSINRLPKLWLLHLDFEYLAFGRLLARF